MQPTKWTMPGLALVPLMVTLAALACNPSEEAAESRAVQDLKTSGPQDLDPLSVYVVNYPLQYFAKRIGGDLVDVKFPAPQDVDPASWSPGPETVVAYQSADLILLNGTGYAKWVQRATLPEHKLVDTTAETSDRLISIEEGVTHTHGLEGEHVHKGYEITTWFDPTIAIEQAKAIRAAFSAARPEQAATFDEGLAALEMDLGELDQAWESAAGEIGNDPMLLSQPSFLYLARRYDMNGRVLHWDPNEMPTEDMWHDLERLLLDHQAALMLWNSRPLEDTVKRLADMGIDSVVIDPSANVPDQGDFQSVMIKNASRLKEAIDKMTSLERGRS